MAPRNLLFIFSDQHAQRVAGCYGDTVVETPNIDRLAREGVTFDNAYCPSPICVPSRMAALTARWPFRQECWTNDDFLRSDLPTWLHGLGAAGRRPVLVGRLHAMGPDQMHGYADRYVGEHSPNWSGVPRHSMGVLEGTNEPDSASLARAGPGMSAYQLKDRAVTDAAVDWIRSRAAGDGESDAGFCLTVGYMLPHPPYVCDPEAYANYEGRVSLPRIPAPQRDEHAFHHWWRENRGISEVADHAVMQARAAYWGLVHRLDGMIGELLACLEEGGLLDDTLVIYASDHGDHIGERGLWWKHTFYEESVKVPLVMRCPGVLPAGERRSEVVNLIDLSQTMLEAMDASPLPHADGRSFWQVARSAGTVWTNETYSEYCTDPVPYWTGGRAVQQRMIRSGRWKLIVYDSEPLQLFDLEEDPDELNDLGERAKHSEVREVLLRKLRADWDPVHIAERMRERRSEKNVIDAWARSVRPKSELVWSFDPQENRLQRRDPPAA